MKHSPFIIRGLIIIPTVVRNLLINILTTIKLLLYSPVKHFVIVSYDVKISDYEK